MKKEMKILTMTIAFFCMAYGTQAQTINKTDNSFETQLSERLTSINETKNIAGFFENINKLKRLSSMYPNEWLADYYVVLLDVKLSIILKKESLLKDAKKNLAKLKEKDNTNESEILTLEGYYYYALIAQNPQKNGALYYKDVIGSYQKAIALDKNNPRPALMLLIFKKKMSKSTGGQMPDFCKKLAKIESLLKATKPKNNISPKWGTAELKRAQQESCK